MKAGKKGLQWKQIANVKIFSWWEITVFVALFLFLSMLLFPIGKLRDILLTEEDYNLDLSVLYLKKLLKFNYDPQLLTLLIDKEIKLGKYKEALSLIDKNIHFFKGKHRKEILLKKYEILSKLYFSAPSLEEKEKIKTAIKQVLKDYLKEFPSVETYQFVYKTSLSFGFKGLAFESCYRLLKSTKNEECFENFVNLAFSLGEKKKLKEILTTFLEKKRNLKEKKLYKVALYLKDKTLVERLALERLLKGDFSYDEFKKLLNFELSFKDYGKALSFCKLYLKRNSSFKVLKSCINIALWDKNYKEVSNLIKSNLNLFKHNDKVLKFFLKVALSINDRDLALKIADLLFNKYVRGES